MRICHIITRMILGGAQENTLLTCEGLHRRGHDVTLIAGPETGPEGSLHKQAETAGFRFERLPALRRSVHPLNDWRAMKCLQGRLRELAPDIAHTHSSKAGILGRIAARRAGVPHIVHTIHGMSFNRTQPRAVQALYRGLERYCAGFSDRIITVADAMIEQAVAAGLAQREKFTTVYSGMRTEWFDPHRYDRERVRAGWGFPADAVVVATVARLFRNKGYELLLPAMAQAYSAEPRLRFVWIGDGAQRGDYLVELDRLGIRGAVHLTGLVPAEKVGEVLAGADMLAHASMWEGLPRAAVQALLMKKPVVSFAIDGAPEVVIPGRTGILVPLGDVAGLAQAVIDLARDPGMRERYGREGRSLCLERFDHERMVEAIEGVYRELCGRQTNRAGGIPARQG